MIDTPTRNKIIDIIKGHLDCFTKARAQCTILGYEFGIDTDAKSVCYKKPPYGPYESKIKSTNYCKTIGLNVTRIHGGV